ncbi:MAG TPA: MBL fold metallo-hydrolase [Chitinophagaceae bacterium]|nr:MBL fold metallo-hydrolase [Chitinophagaceae bacterium]
MDIKQFEDSNLAHFSYAITDDGAMVVIDPSRDPQPYYDLAKATGTKIIAVIETHSHADFVSSHLEMHQMTGATIYASKLLEAGYPHQSFDEGQAIPLGKLKLTAWNTPGHSLDSISVILSDENEKDVAVFSGDTLFIGDCGRPDLRENDGNTGQQREVLSGQMYHSLKKFLLLSDEVVLYPAHGAGSLCGKALSDDRSSTMGREKSSNWCLQPMSEADFIGALSEGQPFIPRYFPYDVALNRKGAPGLNESIAQVPMGGILDEHKAATGVGAGILMVDTRAPEAFKEAHWRGSINIPDGQGFETWLGSIIEPEESFYLLAADQGSLEHLLRRVAKIGYEPFCREAFVIKPGTGQRHQPGIDRRLFKEHPDHFSIIDVRHPDEAADNLFTGSINIPLQELRNQINELPTHKPLVVHCSSGYRSAIASSIIDKTLAESVEVFDLGALVKDFKTGKS